MPPEGVAKDLGPISEVAATFHLPITVLRSKRGIYVYGQFLSQTSSPNLTHFQSVDEAFAYSALYPVMWRQMSFVKKGTTTADAWLVAFQNQVRFQCIKMRIAVWELISK